MHNMSIDILLIYGCTIEGVGVTTRFISSNSDIPALSEYPVVIAT